MRAARWVAVVALALAALVATPAHAAKPVYTLTISDAAPVYGQVVSFSGDPAPRVQWRSKEEVSVACLDAEGVMVLQGAVRLGQTFTMTDPKWNGQAATCEASWRIVEMYKSGVTVLDTLQFEVGAAEADLFVVMTAAKPVPVAASISINEPAPYSLGDTLTFTTTGKPTNGGYLMVSTACYQDVDGDGLVSFSFGDIVYGELTHPDESITLGGYSSIWTERGGGPAFCGSNLVSIKWKGGRQYVDLLASVVFESGG